MVPTMRVPLSTVPVYTAVPVSPSTDPVKSATSENSLPETVPVNERPGDKVSEKILPAESMTNVAAVVSQVVP